MLIGSPDLAGLVAAFIGAFVLGLPFGVSVSSRLGWGLPGALVLSMSLFTALSGLAAGVCTVLGLGLSTATACAILGVFAADVLSVHTVRISKAALDWQGVFAGLLVGAIAFYERPWFGFVSDTFYHLAAARSLLARNASLVTDPFFGTATAAIDPTAGVFHSGLAMISLASGIEVEHVFLGTTAVGAAVVAWAFWALAKRVSGSGAIAAAATFGFLLLGLWGDFRTAGYPNRFAVAFVCIALLAMWESSRHRTRGVAIVATVFSGAAALSTHIASAGVFLIFGFAAALVTVVGGRRLRAVGRRGPSLVPIVSAVVLGVSALAPRLAVIFGSTSMSTDPEELFDIFVRLPLGLVIARPGPYIGGAIVSVTLVLIVLIGAFSGWRNRDGRTLTIAAFLAVVPALLFFPPVTTLAVGVSQYMTARLVRMLLFVPFLGAAWALGQAFGPRRGEAGTAARTLAYRTVVGFLGVALLAGHFASSWPYTRVTFVRIEGEMRVGDAYTVSESREEDVRNAWGLSALWDARAAFGDEYPTVAASPETGYYLAGLANCAIVAAPSSHSPLAVETVDGPQRRSDMEALLDPDTSVAERAEILRARGAKYVALSPGTGVETLTWESMQTQPELFEPVVVTRRFVLLRVLQ